MAGKSRPAQGAQAGSIRRSIDRTSVPTRCGSAACTGGDDWYACAIDGIAGTNAATVEVEQDNDVVSTPVESPLGAFVVAVEASSTSVIRVRAADGRVLDKMRFDGPRVGASSA